MTGTVLAFGLGDGELSTLQSICDKTELQLRRVRQEEYGNPLGTFVGLFPKKAPAFHQALPGKMLVFAFVPDPMLDYVLAEIRKAGVAQGSYKAVLTKNNMVWTVPDLFSELQREREALQDYH